MKRILFLIGASLGLLIGYLILYFTPSNSLPHQALFPQKGEVIGFLPFSLLSRASDDYTKEITTLAYFALTVDTDGTILKLNNPQEEEPGWYALHSGKVSPFLSAAKKNNISLSLVMFMGNNAKIDALMSDPIPHAKNLTKEVIPLMKQYDFTNLNIDIESTKEATPSAQAHFIQFVKTIKKDLTDAKVGTLTIDISTLDVIRHDLIKPRDIAPIADSIVLMAYDFHSTVSSVTGAVAPLSGAGIDAEYDVTSALQKALDQVPPQKLVLGVPLYGYEWEALSPSPRSAIIPRTGTTLSARRAESVLAGCSTCSAEFDSTAQEDHISYKDSETGAYYQLFYPNDDSTLSKITLARNTKLKGLALWALGYEGSTTMDPLTAYKK